MVRDAEQLCAMRMGDTVTLDLGARVRATAHWSSSDGAMYVRGPRGDLALVKCVTDPRRAVLMALARLGD
jgi:hypothetical protein